MKDQTFVVLHFVQHFSDPNEIIVTYRIRMKNIFSFFLLSVLLNV